MVSAVFDGAGTDVFALGELHVLGNVDHDRAGAAVVAM
jgi:hypothetical protein